LLKCDRAPVNRSLRLLPRPPFRRHMWRFLLLLLFLCLLSCFSYSICCPSLFGRFASRLLLFFAFPCLAGLSPIRCGIV
jgi:hypothetical protein